MASKKRPLQTQGDGNRAVFLSSLGKFFRSGYDRLYRLLRHRIHEQPVVSGNNPRASLGRRGEQAAAEFLLKCGYTILARNVRYPEGEVDIVASDRRWLVFVEVRTRRSLKCGPGQICESVTPAKQRRIVRAAQRFRRDHQFFSLPCRFDVITVNWPEDQDEPGIIHFPRAFDAD